MSQPSWLILLWCGAAATLLAAAAGTVAGGGHPGTWSLSPRSTATAGQLRWTLLAGAIMYPVLYGLIFEISGRADVKIGLLAGALHALLAFLAAAPRRDPGHALRVAFMHLVYGASVAFLYVTP